MSDHSATIDWTRTSDDFEYDSYPRDHRWIFDSGTELAASAAPGFLGNPANVDPEEAFVASIASCHMLTFLALAARKRFVVDRYRDEAVGTLEKNDDGRLAITRVRLRPRVTFGGERRPAGADLDRLHHQAHEHCFIAGSVRSTIEVAPEPATTTGTDR